MAQDQNDASQPSSNPKLRLRDEDISVRSLTRRSWLQTTGVVVMGAALTTTLQACSDSCDVDVTDPRGAASDRDAADPARSDNDFGDACDFD